MSRQTSASHFGRSVPAQYTAHHSHRPLPLKRSLLVVAFDEQGQTANPAHADRSSLEDRLFAPVELRVPQLAAHADVARRCERFLRHAASADHQIGGRSLLPVVGSPEEREQHDVLENPGADETADQPGGEGHPPPDEDKQQDHESHAG